MVAILTVPYDHRAPYGDIWPLGHEQGDFLAFQTQTGSRRMPRPNAITNIDSEVDGTNQSALCPDERDDHCDTDAITTASLSRKKCSEKAFLQRIGTAKIKRIHFILADEKLWKLSGCIKALNAATVLHESNRCNQCHDWKWGFGGNSQQENARDLWSTSM